MELPALLEHWPAILEAASATCATGCAILVFARKRIIKLVANMVLHALRPKIERELTISVTSAINQALPGALQTAARRAIAELYEDEQQRLARVDRAADEAATAKDKLQNDQMALLSRRLETFETSLRATQEELEDTARDLRNELRNDVASVLQNNREATMEMSQAVVRSAQNIADISRRIDLVASSIAERKNAS